MAKVKKIVIEVQGKELALSPKAARELRDALDEVLGGQVTRVIDWPPYPGRRRDIIWQTFQSQPAVTVSNATNDPLPNHYRITCANDRQALLTDGKAS